MGTEYPDGGNTSAIIGVTGGNITDRTQMEQVAYAVQDLSINETAEFEEDPAVRASLAPNPPGPARYGVGGSFRISIFLQKMLSIFKALIGDPNAASVAVNDKTLVADGTNVSALNATYFSDENDGTVTAVDSQNLAGTGDKTIADDLSGYTDALTLTVTPTSATLTATATPGTVIITYTKADGTTDARTLSFADGVKGDPQTTTLPADTYISQVQTTGFSAGTFSITASATLSKIRNPAPGKSGRLRFHFSDANVGGQIKIRGLRKGGILDRHVFRHSETIDLSGVADTTAPIDSAKWFHSIREIEVLKADGTAFTDGTVEITSRPMSYVSTFEFKNADIQKMTAELEIAGKPHKITNMILASAVMNVASGGNNLELSVLAERMEELQSIESNIGDEQFQSTRAQYPNDFRLVDPEFFPGVGGYLLLNGEALLTRGATINFTLNRAVSDAIQGGPFTDDFEDQGREISVSLPTYYQSGTLSSDKFVRWQETLRNQEPLRIQVFLYAYSRNGQEHVLEVEYPYGLLTAPVDKNVSGRGRVPIDVDIGAFPDPAVANPAEVIVRLTSGESL